MTKLWPRERLLVRYADDDRLYHLRHVLNARDEGPGQFLTLLPPDRDIERVMVPSDAFLSVVRYMGRALPGIATKLLHTDSHLPAGKFDQDELDEFYAKYENEVLPPLNSRYTAVLHVSRAACCTLPSLFPLHHSTLTTRHTCSFFSLSG